MPASLMTLPNRAMSDVILAANSSGELATTSVPTSKNFFFNSRSAQFRCIPARGGEAGGNRTGDCQARDPYRVPGREPHRESRAERRPDQMTRRPNAETVEQSGDVTDHVIEQKLASYPFRLAEAALVMGSTPRPM